jgi:hypothetical protein
MTAPTIDPKEYRRRRELLKAELRARRDAAPDDYLSGTAAPLPPGHKTPAAMAHHENHLPAAVRRATLRVEELAREVVEQKDVVEKPPVDRAQRRPRRPGVWWFIALPRLRKHRPTGRRKGPHVNDTGPARAASRLIAEWGMPKLHARARLRRAIRRLG